MNAVEKDKWTALHYAGEKGHVDVAKVLLENGADVNAVEEHKGQASLGSLGRHAGRCESVDSEWCECECCSLL